jgi:hypothetical protein
MCEDDVVTASGRLLGLGLACLLVTTLLPTTARAVRLPEAVGGPAGPVVSWGGPTDQQAVLTPPVDLVDAVAVAASRTPGSYSSLALRADGSVVGWGLDAFGEADPPADLTDATAIDLGAGFGLALRADGSVTTWGSDTSGQLDVPADLGPVIAVAAGGYRGYRGSEQPDDVCGFGLAVRADGTVARWGGDTPELACDLLDDRLDPPAGLADVVSVSAGATHALALRSDGTVVTWGPGARPGQDGTSVEQWSDVVAVAAGNGHSLGLRADGTVLASGIWGESGPPQAVDVAAVSAGGLDLFLHTDRSLTVHRGEQPPAVPGAGYLVGAAGADHAVAVLAGGPRVPALLGSAEVQPWTDENRPGTAEAFRYTADGTGNATRFHLYVDERNEARTAVVGVYADTDGEPGRLLTSARSEELVSGGWNTVPLPPVDLAAGEHYWLALLGPTGSGVLRFRDLPDGSGGPTRLSGQQDLGSCGLPRIWRTGRDYANAPASLFLT